MNLSNNLIVYKSKLLRQMPVVPSLIIEKNEVFYYIYFLAEPVKHHWKIEETRLPFQENENLKIIKDTGKIYYEEEILKLKQLRKWEDYVSFTPDPLATELVASTIIANLLEDGKVWLTLIGRPSSGKTWTVQRFSSLEEHKFIYYVGKFSSAALFSAHAAESSIINQVKKGGTIIFRDASSFFARGLGNYVKVMHMLREIYDDRYEDRIYKSVYRWFGKIGIIICATPIIHRHKKYMQQIGDRYQYYRMNSQESVKLQEKDIGEYIICECYDKMLNEKGELRRVDSFYFPEIIDELAVLSETVKTAIPIKYRTTREYVIQPASHYRTLHQLKSLAAGMAIFEGVDYISEEILKKLKILTISNSIERYYHILNCLFIDKIKNIEAIRKTYPLSGKIFTIAISDLRDLGVIEIMQNEIIPGKIFENIYYLGEKDGKSNASL